MTSHDLLAKWVQERDEIAFRDLVKLHAPMVFSTSKRILGNAAEAEDVTQECFETLALSRRTQRGHLGAWLHRVATNRCIDRLRSAQRRSDREKAYSSTHAALAATGWDDLYDQVDAAIANLPRTQREPIVAYFLEGRSHADIANELGLSRQSVTRRIQRGIEGIRKHLHRRGVQISSAVLTALFVQHMNAAAAALPVSLTVLLGKLALTGDAATKAVASGVFAGAGIAKFILGLAATTVIVLGALFVQTTRSIADQEEPVASQTTQAPSPTQASGPTQAPAVPAAVSPPASPPSTSPSTTPAPAVIEAKLNEPESSGASISGIIVRADGKPYSNTSITFEPLPFRDYATDPPKGGIPIIQCDGDQDGKFSKLDLKPGEYSIQVTPRDSHISGAGFELARVTIKENEHRSDLRLVYGTEGKLAITGKLTTGSGQPIQQATITARQGSLTRCAMTDSAGKFNIEFLPEGNYSLHANQMVAMPPDSPYAHRSIDVSASAWAGDQDVSMVISENGKVEGRVVRASDGTPITSFKVAKTRGNIYAFFPELMDNMERMANADGHFSFGNVKPGYVVVTVAAEGFSPKYTTVQLADGQTLKDIVIALSPGPVLHGRVIDESGHPIANAEIHAGDIAEMRSAKQQPAVARSNEDGEFTVSNTPERLPAYAAYHPDFAPAAAAPDDHFVIVMEKAPRLSISVTENGAPLPEANFAVRFSVETRARYSPMGKTDAGGLATVEELVPGWATVEVSRRGLDSRELQKKVLLNAGSENKLSFDFGPTPAALEGIVTWRGAPLKGAIVWLWIKVGDDYEHFTGTTRPEGGYWFDHLPAGTAYMRVYSEMSGRPELYGEVTLIAGTKSRLDLDAAGASRFEGKFVGFDASERLFAIASVGRHTLEEAIEQMRTGEGALIGYVAMRRADANGNYTIEDLEPGEYTIVAQARPRNDWATYRTFAVAHVTVAAGETVVTDFQNK